MATTLTFVILEDVTITHDVIEPTCTSKTLVDFSVFQNTKTEKPMNKNNDFRIHSMLFEYEFGFL